MANVTLHTALSNNVSGCTPEQAKQFVSTLNHRVPAEQVQVPQERVEGWTNTFKKWLTQ